MTSRHLVFLVEERSMEAFLQGFLERHAPEYVSYELVSFQGKKDLLANLEARLRAYSKWIPEHYRMFVMVDRDSDDCLELKARLEETAARAGLVSRSRAQNNEWQVVCRIVIEELEAWYLGDPEAICSAYPRIDRSTLRQRRYRFPDSVNGGTWEAFEMLLQSKRYHRSGLRKIEAAGDMAFHMQPDQNRSPSFQTFYRALQEAIA